MAKKKVKNMPLSALKKAAKKKGKLGRSARLAITLRKLGKKGVEDAAK
jgi:hypothetical protein